MVPGVENLPELGRSSKNCEFCPLSADHGVEVGRIGVLKEFVQRIPYVWVATTSPKKLKTLIDVLGVSEEGETNRIDWGVVMQMPKMVMSRLGPESNYVRGEAIAEEKVEEAWKEFCSNEPIKTCHLSGRCHEKQLAIANDVNSWVGVAGNGVEVEMRKPSSEGVKTRDQLMKYILKRYQDLEKKHELLDKGGMIVHKVEAAIAMLRPIDEKDWSQYKVVSGVSRAFLHFSIEPMLDEEFVNEYIAIAERESGSLENVINAAGGIMHEYLLEMFVEKGYESQLDMPNDPRLTGTPKTRHRVHHSSH